MTKQGFLQKPFRYGAVFSRINLVHGPTASFTRYERADFAVFRISHAVPGPKTGVERKTQKTGTKENKRTLHNNSTRYRCVDVCQSFAQKNLLYTIRYIQNISNI